MSNVYWMRFGTGNPQTTSGLAPTLIVFNSFSGVPIAPPGITEPITGSGLYQFTYNPTFSIAFIADGATTGLVSSVRYVTGVIDPVDKIDISLAEQGTSLLALGTTLAAIGSSSSAVSDAIGSTASSFGTGATDPGTLFGYLKRVQELLEGNQTFNKNTGSFVLYDRTSGTTLRAKTISNASTGVTRI
jgi:hypothetical protein